MYVPPITAADNDNAAELLSAFDTICEACESQVKCQSCCINKMRLEACADYLEDDE